MYNMESVVNIGSKGKQITLGFYINLTGQLEPKIVSLRLPSHVTHRPLRLIPLYLASSWNFNNMLL